MSALSTATFPHLPAQLFPNPFSKPVYRVIDVAHALGINEDTVTYHINKRPNLFPKPQASAGDWGREWKPEQLPQVVNSLLSLCRKAARNVARMVEATGTPNNALAAA